LKPVIVRTLSGLAYIGITVFAIFFGKIAFSAYLCLMYCIISFEFLSLFHAKTKSIGFVAPFVLTNLIFTGFLLLPYHQMGLELVLAAITLCFALSYLFLHGKIPIKMLGATAGNLIYIALPLLLLAFANHRFNNIEFLILAFFVINWTNDTLAYVVGILIGKHKIFPSVSPAKSWEGFIGGFIFSLIFGYILSLFTDYFSWPQWMLLAAAISLSASLGDLFESALKRNVQIKDSGKIMPGHGGLLDRFDGILFSAPVFTVILYLML